MSFQKTLQTGYLCHGCNHPQHLINGIRHNHVTFAYQFCPLQVNHTHILSFCLHSQVDAPEGANNNYFSAQTSTFESPHYITPKVQSIHDDVGGEPLFCYAICFFHASFVEMLMIEN